MTWQSDAQNPKDPPISPLGWLRIILRGGVIIAVTSICLLLLFAVRLIERPIFDRHRPWTPFITQFVCRSALRVLGLRLTVVGRPDTGPGAVVANHTSWLDIFVLNAVQRVTFVAKSEVAKWPGIGILARATGTLFVVRDRAQASAQVDAFRTRLTQGEKLLFFPEGTSSDGLQVLPFKPTLFATFFTPELRDTGTLQPVSVRFNAPPDADPRIYGWWGDMGFATHLLSTLALSPQGSVTVVYHPPVASADFPDRKALSSHLETAVRHGHKAGLPHGIDQQI